MIGTGCFAGESAGNDDAAFNDDPAGKPHMVPTGTCRCAHSPEDKGVPSGAVASFSKDEELCGKLGLETKLE